MSQELGQSPHDFPAFLGVSLVNGGPTPKYKEIITWHKLLEQWATEGQVETEVILEYDGGSAETNVTIFSAAINDVNY